MKEYKDFAKVSIIIAVSAVMIACGGKEPTSEPEPEPDKKFRSIDITAVSQLAVEKAIGSRKDSTYTVTWKNDIAIDSTGLATIMVDWNQMLKTASHVTENRGNYGVYTDRKNEVFAFADWNAADKPKIVASPSGNMPLAKSLADSTLFKNNGGYAFDVKRNYSVGPAETYHIPSMAALEENAIYIEEMVKNGQDCVIDFQANMALSNENREVLETILGVLAEPSSSVRLVGELSIQPTIDSVALTQPMIDNLYALRGKIVPNGTNSFFVKSYADLDVLLDLLNSETRTRSAGKATVRTDRSVNFGGLPNVIPNHIVINERYEGDFSSDVKALPARSGWRNGVYTMETGSVPLVVKDPSVFALVGQPSVPATDTYPKPLVRATNNPNYTDIFMDVNTVPWSDSTHYALNQRIWGNHGETILRATHGEGGQIGKISHYAAPRGADGHGINRVRVKTGPSMADTLSVILLDLNNRRSLPYDHFPLTSHGLEVAQYEIDAKKYCFVMPRGFQLSTSGKPVDMVRDNTRAEELVPARLYNLQESGIGNFRTFHWITWDQYMELYAQGKRAR